MDFQGHKELGVVGNWWQALMKDAKANKVVHPNYFASSPERLQTEAHLGSFIVGNGEDIYSNICSALETAQEEVILITCFWARSSSLDLVSKSLRALSNRVVASKQPKIRIYIGFSSLSALQKLLHTRSTRGTIYSPHQWKSKFWLPTMQELPGLDIQIKSIFVLPFSVMHPKFVIIDRKEVFLPSCNVSWESWFEGCIALSGPIVEQFVLFWKAFWMGEEVQWRSSNEQGEQLTESMEHHGQVDVSARGAAYHFVDIRHIPTTYAIFLPSPHHANPSFSFPWQRHRPAPPTPLNVFVLEAITSATSKIYVQTPNVTSPPVLIAILQALRRGVSVHILTSEKLMILEQLVTAGTTTARCVKKLIKLYKRAANSTRAADEENVPIVMGKLKIEYYQPRSDQQRGEPVQSHLKLTIADDEWTVLGSGNMDRASWYTSQEMGVAFKSPELARTVRQTVNEKMAGRTKTAYDSNTASR